MNREFLFDIPDGCADSYFYLGFMYLISRNGLRFTVSHFDEKNIYDLQSVYYDTVLSFFRPV